jgi:hypothetical protein
MLDYTPLDHQHKFHAGSGRIRLASGGVRSGKTFAGAHEALFLAIEHPGCDGAIVAPTAKMLHSIALKEFRKVCKQFPGLVVGEDKSKEFAIFLANGSTVYYRSADSPGSLDGLTLAWFWADELRHWKKEAWEILVARLSCPRAGERRKGIATSTPKMNWMFEEFHDDEYKDERKIYFFPTDKNHHLAKSYMDGLKASISKARFAEYVLGQFGGAEGSVFPDFNLQKHCTESGVEYDPEHPVLCSFDPGHRSASLLFAQHFSYCRQHNARDCVHVFNEWHPDDTSTSRVADELRSMVIREGWSYDAGRFPYIDKAGNAKNVQRGESDVQILEDFGFRPDWVRSRTDTSIPHGIDLINTKLLNVEGESSLFFAPELRPTGREDRGIIKALQYSEFPDTPGKTKSEHPVKDGFFEHSRDTLRYLLVNLFPYSGKGWVE